MLDFVSVTAVLLILFFPCNHVTLDFPFLYYHGVAYTILHPPVIFLSVVENGNNFSFLSALYLMSIKYPFS